MTFRSQNFWGSGLFTGMDQLVTLTGGYTKEQELVKNWEDRSILIKGAGIYLLTGLDQIKYAYAGFYDKKAQWSSVIKVLALACNSGPDFFPGEYGYKLEDENYINLHTCGVEGGTYGFLYTVYYDKR